VEEVFYYLLHILYFIYVIFIAIYMMQAHLANITSVYPVLLSRKVYHNLSYFLFFFYIVLGLFGCFLTIIKGVVLGVLYLARKDRCGLVSGYEQWDTGQY